MEASHIVRVLSCLNKNLVNISIVPNGFMELNKAVYDGMTERHAIYDNLDDIATEYRQMLKRQNKNTTHDVVINKKPLTKVSPLVSLLFALKKAELEKEGLYTQDEIENIAQEVIKYLATKLNASNAKALDLSKYKLTKKGLQMYLDTCLVANDVAIEPVITLFCKLQNVNVVFVREDGSETRRFWLNPDETCKIIIIHASTDTNMQYGFMDICDYSDYTKKIHERKISEYQSKQDIMENLKTLSVKDLRQIASDIGVDTSHTKKELLRLVILTLNPKP